MVHVNSFLCHHVATKTEDNCNEIGHATFLDATFSEATFSEATFSDATFSELRRLRTKRSTLILEKYIGLCHMKIAFCLIFVCSGQNHKACNAC